MESQSRNIPFRAGFARVDITPPLGISMPGYYQDRRASRILDPLEINMAAFSDGEATALVAQIDTESLSDVTAGRMLDAIGRATGVPRDAVILHASHTHDGGQLAFAAPDDDVTTLRRSRGPEGVFGELERRYRDFAVTRAADAAVLAIRDLKPATLSMARSRAERISFGRRYLMRDGTVRTNPGTGNPDVVRAVGTADDEVQVLRIDREGGRPIAVVNFQTHPDVVGGTTVSADWPGLTRSVFEAANLGGAHCLVLNGTQGDVNHCNVMPMPGEMNGLARDFDGVDRGYGHAKHMANVLAAAALRVWLKCEAVDAGRVRFAKRLVRTPSQKGDVDPGKDLAWARDVWALHEESERRGLVSTDGDLVTAKYGWTGMALTTEVARAGRIINLSTRDDFFDVPAWGIALGRSVSFGAFPGEPFNGIGEEVKRRTPFRMTLLACLANGNFGYFPVSDSYAQGGYESATSPFGPSIADDLIAGQLALQRELFAEETAAGAAGGAV